MKQLPLFADFLNRIVPGRKAKSTAIPKSIKPAGPEIIDVEIGPRTVCVHVYRKTGARNFTLSLTRDHRAVRLSMPKRAALRDGLRFVQEKQALLLKWLDADRSGIVIEPDAVIPFKGHPHRIIWHADFPRSVQLSGDNIHVGGPENLAGKRVLRWLKAQALDDVTRMTNEIALHHTIRVSKIAVNNASARWGSCSSTGAINFSWRLIFAPDAARHYVVCHELAHRTHMNHSAAFWREVERLGGDLAQKNWFKSAAARAALRAGNS
jgi:predicted metal-dependent hydrolase